MITYQWREYKITRYGNKNYAVFQFSDPAGRSFIYILSTNKIPLIGTSYTWSQLNEDAFHIDSNNYPYIKRLTQNSLTEALAPLNSIILV